MIQFSEVDKEREMKIAELKKDSKTYKAKSDQLELNLGTLQINYNKTEE